MAYGMYKRYMLCVFFICVPLLIGGNSLQTQHPAEWKYGDRLVMGYDLTHWDRDKMAATLADDTFKYKFINENSIV